MIAYNSTWLSNLHVQRQLEEAVAASCISKEEQMAGIQQYPVGFYTPNIFIRIGLFILTVVIAFFSIGLLALVMLGNNGEKTFGTLVFLFSFAAYAALELMVKQKNHYQSGADDALMLITGTCIISGLNLLTDVSATWNAIIILILALYFLIRFANAFMGVIAPVAFLAVLFLSIENAGGFAKAIAPFLILLFSAGMYFLADYLTRQSSFKHYKTPLFFIKLTCLICGYAGVNYFVVREASENVLHMNTAEGIPLTWLFWILTVCIPLLYIFLGIYKKDRLFLRVGLLLIAAIVFTVRYYHSVAPIEVAMSVAGAILMIGAYLLIRYLHQPKYGVTSEPAADKTNIAKLNIEALVVAETFATPQPAANPTNFGGGGFGGGGANGDF